MGVALQGVILDVDGTLVLSNDAHAQSWVDAFATFGYEVTFKQVRPLIGMGGDQLMPKLVPGLSEKEGVGKDIADYRHRLFASKYAKDLVASRGTRALVQRMQANGLKLVIASSAKAEQLGSLLKAAQVDDLIQEATTSSDAKASKPEPDIVEAALAKAGLAPDQVVMIGDTPYDIESAGKAGVRVIALRCGGFTDDQLAGAIAIYNDPADLLQNYDASPLAQLAGVR